ncbi:hypothetical protein [Kitasatospora griseola]|uniref:hypothetical protein n=1 Tax=Kitasatospora griseola TaxID=2064 RepID=UPI00381B1D85
MTGDWEAELSSRLEELVMSAEHSAPVPTVDAGSALRRGRKVRRRRLAVATAGVAAVLLGSLTVGLLQGGGPAPVQPAVPTPVDRSPLTLGARFGWLPESTVTLESEWSTTTSLQTAVSKENGLLQLIGSDSEVDPWSTASRYPGDESQSREAAPKVNGRDAYWVSVQGMPTRIELRFRGSDGRWLTLVDMAMPGVDRPVMLRVAAAVQSGAYVVQVPVSLDASTPVSDLNHIVFRRSVGGPDTWELSLQMRVRDNAMAEIEAGTGSEPTDPARARRCAHGEGMWWCAAPAPLNLGAAVAENDVQVWFDRLTAHSRDESTWRPLMLPPH